MSNFAKIFRHRFNYWFPHVRDRKRTQLELDNFYATRQDYHQMTTGPGNDKLTHPQVQVFLQHVKPTDVCVEFGCGGGVVFAAVAERAYSAIGMDIALIALGKARQRIGTERKITLLKADVAQTPVRSGLADVAYSFEVLEHVWNPETVLAEMSRVLKPGGLLFFTTPNQFSLDLHLPKRRSLAAFDHLAAGIVLLRSLWRRRIFENIQPDLQCPTVYPDCDMITSIFPRSLPGFLAALGCRIERLETFFFKQAEPPDDAARRRYLRLNRHGFYRHFGDHILCVARKEP